MNSPIYIEYYSHEACNCYKIDLPYTSFSRERMVLCKVSEGYDMAVKLAKEVILKNLEEALSFPVKEQEIL